MTVPTHESLGDVLSLVVDRRGVTPRKLGGDWSTHGIRVISAMNIRHGQVDAGNVRYVPADLAAKWMPQPLMVGDVILTSEAPLGEVAYWRSSTPVCLGQRLIALRTRPDRVHARYFYFWLRSTDAQSQLAARASGTTVLGIRQSELLRMSMPVPPLEIQVSIANLLGELDDLMQSNRHQASILDELNNLLFMSVSRSPDATERRLGEFVEESRTRILDRANQCVVMSAVSTGRLVPSDEYFSKRVYSANLVNYLAVPQWAFAYNPSRANIGSIGLNESGALGAVSPVYVVAQSSQPDAYWLDVALRSSEVRAQIAALSVGTVRQVLRFDDFASIRVRVPPAAVLSMFNSAAEANRTLWLHLEREAAKLAALRDALLPELLSGRLRVPEAREQVEAVV